MLCQLHQCISVQYGVCLFLVKIDNLIAYAFGEFFLSVIATLSNGDNVVKYPRMLP